MVVVSCRIRYFVTLIIWIYDLQQFQFILAHALINNSINKISSLDFDELYHIATIFNTNTSSIMLTNNAMISFTNIETASPCLERYNGRIMLFSGDVPTIRPGRVVQSSLAHHLRGYKDIVKGEAPLFGGRRSPIIHQFKKKFIVVTLNL